jgi:hypothetical protein
VSSSAQKKHKCKVCDKRFTRPSSLQTHMYSHTGEKRKHPSRPVCDKGWSNVLTLIPLSLWLRSRWLWPPVFGSIKPPPAQEGPQEGRRDPLGHRFGDTRVTVKEPPWFQNSLAARTAFTFARPPR